jgi:hypothetical protein
MSHLYSFEDKRQRFEEGSAECERWRKDPINKDSMSWLYTLS